ncbi:ATP-dependent endonuclease [Vibrio vulnificus]|uniref:AAA family ATPase n=1 Tax=Vibrio vulnificus TaxID=672 RepID=UPI0021DA7878|nr:ATP-binding cassette domain-containing protein [Vibrio vulnificus]MCU8425147.1 AAA family ATPase [Vibrio vulnificus]MCU8430120.1 AAA family ATPase [Vibrio vulnificus]
MRKECLEFGEQQRAEGLKNINILLGKNGAGKSRFLRSIDEFFSYQEGYNIRYISPERAGVFKRDGYVLNNLESDPHWLGNARRVNQAENFKAVSATLLREVETAYLRQLQDNTDIRNDPNRNFRTDRLDSINRLLSNISIYQEGSNFEFRNTEGDLIQPDQISSGESESVSLAVELMYFFDNLKRDRFNLLLLDEPDVHLHPDLQGRLASFIINLVESLSPTDKDNVAVILATHSTPFICALAKSEHTSIGTKDFGVATVSFVEISTQLKKIAPFFGHPLSLSLSQDPMLILEGEDDERVWQQAARSSQGKIKLFPVIASSVDQQTELESFTADMIESLYDEPVAFSLRDGDGVSDELVPIRSVARFRLQCYAIENLLLTDQVLAQLGTTWSDFQKLAENWLQENVQHRDHGKIRELIDDPNRQRNVKIKDIRQLVCAICSTNKPWEVAVGQAIGKLDVTRLNLGDFDLATFIGAEATQKLLAQ